VNATLTQEHEDFLVLIGKPDDGSQTHVVAGGERLLADLMSFGLVYRYKALGGSDTHGLTDEGEAMYEQLRRRPPKARTIEFSGTHRVLWGCDSIAFPARVDGKPVECRISYEALMMRFGSRPGDKECERTYIAESAAIEVLARKMIDAGRIGRDSILRIHS
jgi:hypothetical protein